MNCFAELITKTVNVAIKIKIRNLGSVLAALLNRQLVVELELGSVFVG